MCGRERRGGAEGERERKREREEERRGEGEKAQHAALHSEGSVVGLTSSNTLDWTRLKKGKSLNTERYLSAGQGVKTKCTSTTPSTSDTVASCMP